MLNKLPANGVNNKELNWFKDYLFDGKQIIKYDGTTSEDPPFYCGVLRRSILRPLLLLLYFNDIEDMGLHSETIMFADNTVL